MLGASPLFDPLFEKGDQHAHVGQQIFAAWFLLGDFDFHAHRDGPFGAIRHRHPPRNDAVVAVGMRFQKRFVVLAGLGHDATALAGRDAADVAFLNVELDFEIVQIGHLAKIAGGAECQAD